MITPRLDILPSPQLRLWEELESTPRTFVLHGGTAIALHLGHRASVDFDFFAWSTFDPRDLLGRVPYLRDAEVLETAPNTLTVRVDRGGPVKLSFFGVPRLGRVRPPLRCAGNGMALASLLDLGGLKASVIQVRAEAKDYLDLYALLREGGLGLPEMLAAARIIYGAALSPLGALKALTFYDNGDLENVPVTVRAHLLGAALRVDAESLPTLTDVDRPREDP